ncbi:glycosyl hydrolase family 8 [Virgibacillus ndiopensis]|uniref:glycosyl hydrolase family 8 n=1 Tax=Virgibacillus ndiopensis TaxID=2004408 RepID=UPI00159B8D7F|nr:glycosyl hydrolase family 8 [Virgibacillus ndiopensis]
MRKVIKLLVMLIFIIVIIVIILNLPEKKKPKKFPTESFIVRCLQNNNGTLATYIKDSNIVDEDLVKGREALSETLGLWMLYALEIEDKQLFDETYQNLQNYFLEKDGYISWKINASGKSYVYTNALVDDFRIIDALLQADKKWGNENYVETANLISRYVNKFSKNNNVLTDYYERRLNYSSNHVTLSYIDPLALKKLKKRNWIDSQIYDNTLAILQDAPLKNGFYPKSYHVRKQSYKFDRDVNMVDQVLMAYHQSKVGIVSAEFLNFVKAEIERHGIINGKYDIQTKEPTVEYESPAVYGFLIMYALEMDEVDFARKLYERMIAFKDNDYKSPYYGGYSISEVGDTHIFDNLVPLLAERKLDKVDGED